MEASSTWSPDSSLPKVERDAFWEEMTFRTGSSVVMPGDNVRSLCIHLRLALGDFNAQPSPPEPQQDDEGLIDGVHFDSVAEPHHPPERHELEQSTTDHVSALPDWVHLNSFRRVSGSRDRTIWILPSQATAFEIDWASTRRSDLGKLQSVHVHHDVGSLATTHSSKIYVVRLGVQPIRASQFYHAFTPPIDTTKIRGTSVMAVATRDAVAQTAGQKFVELKKTGEIGGPRPFSRFHTIVGESALEHCGRAISSSRTPWLRGSKADAIVFPHVSMIASTHKEL